MWTQTAEMNRDTHYIWDKSIADAPMFQLYFFANYTKLRMDENQTSFALHALYTFNCLCLWLSEFLVTSVCTSLVAL